MATKIYGSIDEETGHVLSTRSVESSLNVPKIDSALEIENLGFQNKAEIEYGKEIGLWDWWSDQVTFIDTDPDNPVVKKPAILKEGGLFSGAMSKITLLAVVIIAVTVLPRILPVRR